MNQHIEIVVNSLPMFVGLCAGFVREGIAFRTEILGEHTFIVMLTGGY